MKKIILKHTTLVLFATLLMLTGGTAIAAPIATLAFQTPNATVGSTDIIDIIVTLTLDPASDPLTTDAFGAVTSGLTLADIQANLFSGLPAGVDPTTDNLT